MKKILQTVNSDFEKTQKIYKRIQCNNFKKKNLYLVSDKKLKRKIMRCKEKINLC